MFAMPVCSVFHCHIETNKYNLLNPCLDSEVKSVEPTVPAYANFPFNKRQFVTGRSKFKET